MAEQVTRLKVGLVLPLEGHAMRALRAGVILRRWLCTQRQSVLTRFGWSITSF